MRELRIPTRKTNPIHNDVPENTTFLLPDQPSGEANTTGTLINKINEVAINAKTANWKAIVMFLILQSTNKRIIPFDPFISQKIVKKKKKRIMEVFYHESIIDSILTYYHPLPLHGIEGSFFLLYKTKGHACWIMHLYYIYIYR
jgi:hypothetical protein